MAVLFFIGSLYFLIAPCPVLASKGNAAAMGGELSILNRQGSLSVNQLNGQAFFNISLASISCKSGLRASADLSYSSLNINRKVDSLNENVLVGCVGLGWNLGTSFIRVFHNNTVTTSDDKWFFHYSSGAESEITKPAGGIFRIKYDPASLVTPHYVTNDSIIDGWIITQSDGSVLKFGDFGGAANANRYVQCQGDTISANLSGATRPFYYQWDLSSVSDVNHDSLTYLYYSVSRNVNGLAYTGESYLRMIQSNIGDKIWFDYMGKNNTEDRSVALPSPSYNIYEHYYLGRIRLLNHTGWIMDTLNFSYSSINPGVTGKEKRVLTGITSKKGDGSLDHVFWYSDTASSYKGYLVTISNPKIGKSLTFNIVTGPQNKGRSTFIVDWTKAMGGVAGMSDPQTFYSYTTDTAMQYYDSINCIAYWGVVTQNSRTGNIVSAFDIDTSGNTFGTLKRVDMYNMAGKKVATQTTSYAAINLPTWCITLPTSAVSTVNGIVKNSGTPDRECGINITNFQTYFSYVVNSDRTALCTEKTFAYEKYGAMYTANILLPVAGVKAYKVPNYSYDCNVTDSMVVNATFTTWSDASGVWRPKANYIWNVAMDASGNPSIPFVEFDTLNPTVNHWKCTGTFDRYDNHGHLLQESNAIGVTSCTIYGTQAALPIGTIRNAAFFESGVFTCDYDLNEYLAPKTYLDKTGGWVKGNTWDSAHNTITISPTHFGQKSLRLNNGGAGILRVCKVNGGVNYTFSAWTRVDTGTLTMTAQNYTGSPTVASWPVNWDSLTPGSVAGTASQTTTSGNWQLVKTSFTVPTGNSNYILAYIGGSGSYDAHVDDIRFGPSNAKISTTYYDTLWQQPILSVGPDNNPGDMVEYDNFGRQTLTYKVNKNTNDLTVKGFKTYHLMNETPLFDATQWYKIVAKLDTTKGVDIKNGNVSIYPHQPLQLFSIAPGNNQLWKFIPVGEGSYYIRSKANTAFYVDDPYKTLTNGSQLQIWNGLSYNQRWIMVPLRDGSYRIAPFASEAKAMEYNAPSGEAPSDTAHVQISSYKSKENQKWVVKAVP